MSTTDVRSSFVETDSNLTAPRNPLDIQGIELLFKNIASNPSKPPSQVVLNSRYENRWSQSNINIVLPLTARQFAHGQSNPTYLVTDAHGFRFVLRRKPSSNSQLFSKTAHAIEREFFMLNGISQVNATNKDHHRDVPVSEVYLLCEDESYIGAVFYLMEFVQGRIFHDASLSGIPEGAKMAYYQDAVRVASNIHSIPSPSLFKKLPPSHFKTSKNLAQESSYFHRQVKSLSKVHASQCKTVAPIPHFTELSRYLLDHAPQDPNPLSPNLIHGDFKMDNLIYHPTKPHVIAVLDWELTTNGHPIFDLSNLLQPWVFPSQMNRTFSNFPIDPSPLFIQKMLDEYKHIHEPESWDPSKVWKQGTVFALYRVAVILHGIAARVERGVASSTEAKKVARLFPEVGEFAFKVMNDDSFGSGSSTSDSKL